MTINKENRLEGILRNIWEHHITQIASNKDKKYSNLLYSHLHGYLHLAYKRKWDNTSKWMLESLKYLGGLKDDHSL